jgi:uncharacterized protein (DUF1015 family)
MAIIKPFQAIRPKPELADKVASLPYDVMNTEEARTMANGNPYSFLHVSRAEIDLAPETDVHSQQVYLKARENFLKMIADGVLFQDTSACFYVYSLVMNGRRQVGLVACSSIDDYFNDVIKKHEFTRPEKEQDRIDHMVALKSQVGPVFLTYKKNDNVNAIIDKVMMKQAPVYDFAAADRVRHTIWVINDSSKVQHLTALFEQEIPVTYIADGHHRTASSAKVGKKLRELNPNHNGSEEYNFFLSVLFPHDQLAILDYNRVVKDLNGLTPDEFLNLVKEKFEVRETVFEMARPQRLHEFGMLLGRQWYQLSAKPGTWSKDPIGVLDISILSENILAPILNITDQRTDKRIDFVGGIRGMKELEKRVNNGDMQLAFALYPVSLQQLMDISDSGNIMPPKSTWFEPKLRDGLFCHAI